MIAGPLLDAMKYCGAEKHLREIFANLLTTSMDARTVATAHPAFVEMAKQLSPDEARMLHKWSSTLQFSFDPSITLYSTWEALASKDSLTLKKTKYHRVFGPYSRTSYHIIRSGQ